MGPAFVGHYFHSTPYSDSRPPRELILNIELTLAQLYRSRETPKALGIQVDRLSAMLRLVGLAGLWEIDAPLSPGLTVNV
jgi:hypothetical protein